ncbi:hypothetical protein [Hymenobacter sp. BRD67]|uniref:hypothetical protein n=1 Tax=Hymenobacter sp. BRD67 TaxID=2675877 RepID=UPI001565D9D4|nr:hypothetical protein [Hymenobacter sp. BRD67]QKG51904.1 hypothetical protein GKZ67_03855 [Hymenobacter sp. BRD67]
MKTIVLVLLGACLLSAQAATAGRRPKARDFAHTNDAKNHSAHMRFRHNPHPLPMIDLKAHNAGKFRTVRANKNYKFE